jgi:hypothetical protein
MHVYYSEPHKWFAWRPVIVNGRWAWFRTVMRDGYVLNGFPVGWRYAEIE